ncbi:hypothetical protein HN588_03430 [Candidatus Bathyarchaeota archaeon]|jgi:hypothetical protein|nr:hypothetical protein [Candidatus Bathyarchaeota archaeon]
MTEEISGEDVIYGQLREGDLLRFDPLSAHSLRGDILPDADLVSENLIAYLDGKPIIYSDNYLVVDVKLVANAMVEVSFLCFDDTNRGVTVEVFPVLRNLGSCTWLVVGPIPMDCRGVLTPAGPKDRKPSMIIKAARGATGLTSTDLPYTNDDTVWNWDGSKWVATKIPRKRLFKPSEYVLLALSVVVGIIFFVSVLM